MIFLIKSNVSREGIYQLCENAVSPAAPHSFYFHVLNPIIDTNYMDCVKIQNNHETLIGGDISIVNEYFDKAVKALTNIPVSEDVAIVLADRIKCNYDEVQKYFNDINNVFISVTPETERFVLNALQTTVETLLVTDKNYLITENVATENDATTIVPEIAKFRVI